MTSWRSTWKHELTIATAADVREVIQHPSSLVVPNDILPFTISQVSELNTWLKKWSPLGAKAAAAWILGGSTEYFPYKKGEPKIATRIWVRCACAGSKTGKASSRAKGCTKKCGCPVRLPIYFDTPSSNGHIGTLPTAYLHITTCTFIVSQLLLQEIG
jgi:hypothetical protein